MFVISGSPDEMYAITIFYYCGVTPLFSKPLFQSNSPLFMKTSEKTLYCHMRKDGFSNRN